MVAPLHLPPPVPLPVRDAELDADLDALTARHHPGLRAALAALAPARGHIASHDPALAAAFDQLDAALGAGLAREARVLTPHLRALAAGAPDHTLFASLAALVPVVTADQRATTTALGRVLAALTMTAPGCPACATAADDAADLACALAAHHRFTLESLLPRARTRELALGPDPVR